MQMPENARLKRLLDKKRRALLLPKSELCELESEYAENDNLKWLIQQSAYKKQIESAEALVRKSADSGDIEDCKYYMQNLIGLWARMSEEALKNHQIDLLE